MAKRGRKKKKKVEDILQKQLTITAGAIKDDFCHYSYKPLEGVQLGDEINVKGKGQIRPDLRVAFSALAVHLAIALDIFKHAKVEFEDLSELTGHELTMLFEVTGLKIKGDEENERVILIGTMHTAMGRFDLHSPEIHLDNMSGYKWVEELVEALDGARKEVELYKNGKCDRVDPNAVDPNQVTISDGIAAAENDDVFNKAKVGAEEEEEEV